MNCQGENKLFEKEKTEEESEKRILLPLSVSINNAFLQHKKCAGYDVLFRCRAGRGTRCTAAEHRDSDEISAVATVVWDVVVVDALFRHPVMDIAAIAAAKTIANFLFITFPPLSFCIYL